MATTLYCLLQYCNHIDCYNCDNCSQLSTDQSNCQVTQVSTHLYDHHRQVSTYQSITMCGPAKYSRKELLKYNIITFLLDIPKLTGIRSNLLA